jgi:ring-1,2-phenylacetyl-CoA epoxidase subunit PaaE
MSKTFHPLVVKEVVRETPQAVTLKLMPPPDAKALFQYHAGQYLTLRFHIDGQELRRSYSMCGSPLDPDLAVTVKRVDKGLVSGFVNNQLQPGDIVEAMPPEGRFFVEFKEEQRKTYYLFGAGSGITPLMSILRAILEQEPLSNVNLLYGNRDEESIIFRAALEELVARYEGQLVVEHILSKPRREKGKGLVGLFGKGATTWSGRVGRIDAREVNRFLDAHSPRVKEVEYFICGPGNMIDTVKTALLARGIDQKKIHLEYFSSAAPVEAPVGQARASANGADALIKARLDGQDIEVTVPAEKTILATLLDAGYDPPYSCMAGACSTCMAKMLSGSVRMEACYALDEDEVREGYILTCQSHPTAPEVTLTYDV